MGIPAHVPVVPFSDLSQMLKILFQRIPRFRVICSSVISWSTCHRCGKRKDDDTVPGVGGGGPRANGCSTRTPDSGRGAPSDRPFSRKLRHVRELARRRFKSSAAGITDSHCVTRPPGLRLPAPPPSRGDRVLKSDQPALESCPPPTSSWSWAGGSLSSFITKRGFNLCTKMAPKAKKEALAPTEGSPKPKAKAKAKAKRSVLKGVHSCKKKKKRRSTHHPTSNSQRHCGSIGSLSLAGHPREKRA